jgi:hypothetical protein
MQDRRRLGHGRAVDLGMWRGLGRDGGVSSWGNTRRGWRGVAAAPARWTLQTSGFPPLADGGCGVGAAADVAFVVEKDPGWAGGSGGGIGGHREVV